LIVPHIEIVDYRPEWSEEFRRIGAVLRSELADTAIRINHIGSTAVTGLPAKDVIDVQVSVATLELGEETSGRFGAAGYPVLEGLRMDHVPIGAADGDGLWTKRMAVEQVGQRRAHVHIRVVGHPNERYSLLFRDFLRADRSAAGSYGSIKRELARLHPHDVDAYYSVKDPACDLIIAAAERWAEMNGWQLPDTDA
jgi:GrpB-like predicted nucleotidyltransferase (UPF0157 family)